MNDSMQRPQSLLIVAGIYIGTCFVTAIVLNALSVLIAPPAFTLAARTWLASFLFVGAFTTTCCAGGLLGIWFIIASTDSSIRDHIKTAILVGIVSSGLFFIEVVVEHLKRMAEEDSARFLRIMESSLCRTVPLIPVLSFA